MWTVDVAFETGMLVVGPARAKLSICGDGGLTRPMVRELAPFFGPASSTYDASIRIGRAKETGAGLQWATARGEIGIALRQGPIQQIVAWPVTTPRSLARALKFMSMRAWHESRRRLLLRYGIQHCLMAILDYRYGFLTVHSAAVESGGKAVLFLGSNGAGKTTLAHQLIHRAGFRLMSDNFSPTDGVKVLPFPGLPRVKDPEAGLLVAESWSPAIKGAELGAIVLLCQGASLRQLQRDEAELWIQDYMGKEREDHRDSTLGKEMARGMDARNECEVISRMAKVPTFAFDWRRESVQRLLDEITS